MKNLRVVTIFKIFQGILLVVALLAISFFYPDADSLIFILLLLFIFGTGVLFSDTDGDKFLKMILLIGGTFVMIFALAR